ncbi:CehA/McbA family metallohydrolase [Streptomyces sp. AV19]|uniref:CehA/McbA family metallohydrolase n=1 Tax=Streptomyces sp. AV19 TaxID=2793068 RepID=UPI0018FE3FE9|nr:CehA/McbA family metallohydrolase [Streptomyces sp. AV19]MBH1935287.1 CehA/McbA family metallohydrolase [Streptomyces sp. AV19]MDG4531173.1 CehA/McbA family metallohydrolase [Streptomyces sp. AV19]
MERRNVLKLTAGTLTLGGVTPAPAAGADGPAETRRITGRLPAGAPDYVYLPVEVPRGIREITVSYAYDRPSVPAGVPGNACDIGIFDERGTGLGGAGFRGWSGGARTEFSIAADRATPGYLPGPVRSGTWHVVLGPYTVAPQGLAYEVTVTLRYGPTGAVASPVFPPQRARGRGRAWYRGDGHLHSVHSDGLRTPAEIAASARAAGLDWIVTTEHNTTSGHGAWEGLWGDDFLILTGEEITTRNGHVLALGTDPGVFVDWRYRARDGVFPRFARTVRRAGGLVVPAHPFATCPACNWKFGFDEADAVEVWNGPWTQDDEMAVAAWDALLAGGHWLPAMGNSDAHRAPQPVGSPHTVVLADDLSRPALLSGLRAGSSWIAESSAVGLSFGAVSPRGAHAGMGERLRAREATIRLQATGVPPGATASFITDQGTLLTVPVPEDGLVDWRTSAARSAYVRAEVRRREGGMVALTNPVFLGEARA